nr:MAG TPA: hypothetical protein [Caudoviricetes sp.]
MNKYYQILGRILEQGDRCGEQPGTMLESGSVPDRRRRAGFVGLSAKQ